MKKTLFSLAILMSALQLFGQTDLPTYGYNYQAIIRHANGSIVANEVVQLQFQILNSANQPQYEETHTTSTDQFGKVALTIGTGTDPVGKFDTLNWAARKHFLAVSVSVDGGAWADLGKEEIVLQPFAGGAVENLWSKNNSTSIQTPYNVHALQNLQADGNVYFSTWGEHFLELQNSRKRISIPADPDGGIIFYTHSTQINPRWQFKDLADDKLMAEIKSPSGDVWFKHNLSINSWEDHMLDLQADRKRISVPADPDGAMIFYTHTAQIAPRWEFRDLADEDLKFRIKGTSGDIWAKGEGSFSQVVVRGNDRAHLFNTTTGQALPPGTVVVFDETQTGKIRPCTTAYDRKIPGVISDLSGMGKYRPGIIHAQECTQNGSPVAMDGTVEVFAIGPIAVGDKLTTSNVPGHAMKAKNRRKSEGAVIGRAITTLGKGEKGKVEVFVERR